VEDIFEDLGIEIQNLKFKISDEKSEIQNGITDANQLLILKVVHAAGKPVSIDKIIETSKLDPQTANQSIALLTIAGAIKETGGNYTI
jgi:hypothetical protein